MLLLLHSACFLIKYLLPRAELGGSDPLFQNRGVIQVEQCAKATPGSLEIQAIKTSHSPPANRARPRVSSFSTYILEHSNLFMRSSAIYELQSANAFWFRIVSLETCRKATPGQHFSSRCRTSVLSNKKSKSTGRSSHPFLMAARI